MAKIHVVNNNKKGQVIPTFVYVNDEDGTKHYIDGVHNVGLEATPDGMFLTLKIGHGDFVVDISPDKEKGD